MSIKKEYVAIVEFLEANKNKKVATILEELTSMCTAKVSETSLYHEDKLVAVFCYYHKQWELVSATDYGTKKGTKTGLNSMCKEGVNKWTKQQTQAKKEKSYLLTAVSKGEIDASEINQHLADIEVKRTTIEEGPEGFKTSAEALDAYLSDPTWTKQQSVVEEQKV